MIPINTTNLWRRRAQEQFREHAHELETCKKEDWNFKFSKLFFEAATSGDADKIKNAVSYLCWCWDQRRTDEQFFYLTQRVLQHTLNQPIDRAAFCSAVDPVSFASIYKLYAIIEGPIEAEVLEREFKQLSKVNNFPKRRRIGRPRKVKR